MYVHTHTLGTVYCYYHYYYLCEKITFLSAFVCLSVC